MHTDFKPVSGNTVIDGFAVITQDRYGAGLLFFNKCREVVVSKYLRTIDTRPLMITSAKAIFAENGNVRLWTKTREENTEEILNLLPVTHPLRNKPLHIIGAETVWKEGKVWKRIEPHWKIAKCTFNELGSAWTDSWLWKASV